MSLRPEYISLPSQYINTIIKEKMPPEPEKRCIGRPFFNSPESHSVCYINNQYMVRKNNELIPLETDVKGYCCVGCEPGSFPQPIIIAHIDNKSGEIGLIKPYVYITNKTNEYVDLKVGGDMAVYDDGEHRWNEFYYSYDNNPEVYTVSDKYKIVYYDKKYVLSVNLCLSMGTFW